MQNEAVTYFCGEELPASVFVDKYALRDRQDNLLEPTPDGMHRRIARELARVEAKKFRDPYSEEFIYGLLKDFGPIIPQGSPMYGIGNGQYITLSNCYVVDSPLDSYGSIHHTDEQLTQISKRRGGVGTDVSHIRPNNSRTTNAARRATGVVGYCERYSNSIREVGQNGRRGALMLTLSVHHPEVLDFARMKLDPKKVTGANVSVRLSDEFLRAVKEDGEYEQRWPVDSATPTVSRKVKAREVWREIIRCAWSRAEPGLLFWDHIIRESPADCYAGHGFRTESTNPCSELPLCPHDSCRLLLLNLFAFVVRPFQKDAHFDFKAFYDTARVAQRLMDDIVDLELECVDRILRKVQADPEPDHVKANELRLWGEIRRKCEQGRRTGTGITALADAMAAVGERYGTDASIEFTDRVYATLKFACYRASVDMAKELGPFPIWDPETEKACPFLNRINDEVITFANGSKVHGSELYADMVIRGRRNIAILTTAPAGSTSLLAGPRPYFGSSSGIEPLFTDAPYIRRKKITPGMADAKVDFVDELGDKWSHFEVFHSKLRMWMDLTGETDWKKSPYHGCTANDIDWRQRVRLQAAAQRHVDHAISSTLNLPGDVSEEKVAEIYEAAWEAGCKGITVYRDGCRDGVLVKESPRVGLQKTQAPKRPKELPCDIYRFTVKKEPFVVLVGLMGDEPYEVFAFSNTLYHICADDGLLMTSKADAGVIRKVKRGVYELWSADENLLADVPSISSLLNDTEEAVTRMASTALRHGADINYVVHQLEKTKDGDLHSFTKALARALKKYVKDGTKVSGEKCQQCGQESLVRQEGCCTCRGCGWSKCS
jgi:ribonucleoside-diphosphate reductase alpha chain